ncbi:hypothetical protein MUCCIDRAFT_109120 [Mucor lusitanicus CBS 277.49]|uniref:G-protein coupled receptors family 3 profile domain-containing protein n=1 Tax=Mucor lusitanicus CBS 277.49 TaxID=747725 RepID=A0A162MTJ8_MUCCL|nr:hypothetical protein MUCCIDRAFT_109120 [Mucor lusitanicus CBS 277.49]
MNDLQVDVNNTILSAGDTKTTTTSNGKLEIKIGILLHNETRQGLSGVQIAVNEINQWDIIPGAFVTLIEKDVVDYQPIEQDQFSSIAISQAIYSVVSLIQQGVIGIIGDVSDSFTTLSALMTGTLEIPQCSYSATAVSLADKSQYDYFFRTIPTDLLHVDTIISFTLSQNWTTLGILYTRDADLVTQNLISKTKKMGILSVKSSQTYKDEGNTNNIHASIDTLMSLGSRVVVIASKDSAAKALLIAAISGHVNNETAWLIMGSAANVIRQLNQHVDVYNRIVQTRLNNANQSNVSTTNTTYKDAVEQLAWSTDKLDLLTMERLFAGGVFIFEQQTELAGYPPYDTFQQKLSQFDPLAANSSTYQSGLAYSCMMTMAHGFGQLVRDSIDSNYTLQELTSGQLVSRYSLSLFNDTGFTTGPQGPILFDKNGDIQTGNFKIFNLHHGSQVTEIGYVLGGTFHLSTTDPIYFDGTKTPPLGTPSLTVIKAGITAPISIATASTAMVGIATTLIALIMVIKFRHHTVFKSSSSYSIFTCFMLPITFYIGLSLILGTMISRNYRVYKMVNNVYNNNSTSNHHSSSNQLLKISCFILAFNTFILACWLVLFGNVKLSAIPVSSTVVVNTCSYDGPGHTFFVALLTILAGIQLCLSVYLSLKTKVFGSYSKYSEHKQLGLSV